jgi:hypothetical protein
MDPRALGALSVGENEFRTWVVVDPRMLPCWRGNADGEPWARYEHVVKARSIYGVPAHPAVDDRERFELVRPSLQPWLRLRVLRVWRRSPTAIAGQPLSAMGLIRSQGCGRTVPAVADSVDVSAGLSSSRPSGSAAEGERLWVRG